jgi:hypothetical protein
MNLEIALGLAGFMLTLNENLGLIERLINQKLH